MTLTKLTQSDIIARDIQTQIASIKSQLAELDTQVPRIVEDMIPLVSGLTISSTKQGIIDKKIALRLQLTAS
jgi:hypothetical protein